MGDVNGPVSFLYFILDDSGSEFYKNSLGYFTCRKAGTWDILFYFPSEGRHTEDFSDAGKNPKASAGFEPANSGSSGQYTNH
jgi:hypothetical protein